MLYMRHMQLALLAVMPGRHRGNIKANWLP
jgi:hypothetical protein